MAEIVGGGTPVNDSERAAIAHLRDHGPDDWVVLHNIEIARRDGAIYEIDLVVVTRHSVCLIDVKGVHGRIEIDRHRWYPPRGTSFASPVAKLRGHARAVKGEMQQARPALSRVYVDALVVLTADDAVLVDPDDRPDADANDVTTLPRLIRTLSDVSRVRAGFVRDLTPYRQQIIEAFLGRARLPTGPKRFGDWAVVEELGGTDEVTEYRATNATVPVQETVLLRVYRADPFQPEPIRAAERIAIANAYEVLVRMPPSDYIVGRRHFFAVEDESQYVLVLDDVGGRSLHLHLDDARRPLGTDTKVRVIHDILRGLAHAHRFKVIHRALSPSTVLVTEGGRAVLTGFDYAKPEGPPRANTVAERLTETLDPAYVAPECQARPQAMSRAADVYAAGVIAFRLLTGELPFATSTEQHERRSVLPRGAMASAGVPDEVAELLQRLCAMEPRARPDAAEAAEFFRRLLGGGGGAGGHGDTLAGPAAGDGQPDYFRLPEGYQLTRKYTIRRRLGSGTFGVVYQVYDNLAAGDRVIKIVMRDRQSLIERLRQEYRILLELAPHHNVVRAESADYLEGGIPYLVFEYLEGRDVGELVHDRPDQRLGPADAVKLAADVACGLVHLHANGVYHCDIKPRNLLWTDDGCKIIDFNVSVTADSSMSRAGGTSRYTPPDLRSVAAPTAADLADRDVYALGVTFYQVVTGRWPFAGTGQAPGEQPVDPSTLTGLADLSDALVATMMKVVAPIKSERYASAAAFLEALRDIGDEVHRRQPAASPEPARPRAGAHVNPFVEHLRTLYSQSTSSNAGTRGHDPYDLYVRTALDERLVPDVLAGAYDLVVITGNAGDGKTALLEHLVAAAKERGGVPGEPRENGADVRLLSGRWLRTNHDGSQDEGDAANDEVLLRFFAPFVDAAPAAGAPAADQPAGDADETRLIAINEGRLVDFLDAHADRFAKLAGTIRAGLAGRETPNRVAVINLNRRSVVAGRDDISGSIFERLLRRMTHPRFWEDCASCELAQRCYAPHNARTFAHPSAGAQVIKRLEDLYTVADLRGRMHITLRDLRSALAFMLTSGRGCADIHELYKGNNAEAILDSFYFNSWAGRPDTKDRLLAFLRQVDVAAVPDPALDRRIDYTGPDAGQAVITVDQRGRYDVELLATLFGRLPRGSTGSAAQAIPHRRYLAAARRRFYFECVDDGRAVRLLPYRSAGRFLDLLRHPDKVPDHLPAVIAAINRGEGLPDPGRLGDVLALQVRHVVTGTIRSYRLFPAETLSLTTNAGLASPYLEDQPSGLLLRHDGVGGHRATLDIRLDLFELLERLGAGYLPDVAERQGLYLGLTIFKNELAAAPYSELLLTTGGRDLRRVRRTADGRLVMEGVS
jgi:serine/threonine protein kinase